MNQGFHQFYSVVTHSILVLNHQGIDVTFRHLLDGQRLGIENDDGIGLAILFLTDNIHDSRSVIRPDADQCIHFRMVGHGIADIFPSASAVHVIAHIIDFLKLGAGAFGKAVHPFDGVLRAGSSDERDISSA